MINNLLLFILKYLYLNILLKGVYRVTSSEIHWHLLQLHWHLFRLDWHSLVEIEKRTRFYSFAFSNQNRRLKILLIFITLFSHFSRFSSSHSSSSSFFYSSSSFSSFSSLSSSSSLLFLSFSLFSSFLSFSFHLSCLFLHQFWILFISFSLSFFRLSMNMLNQEICCDFASHQKVFKQNFKKNVNYLRSWQKVSHFNRSSTTLYLHQARRLFIQNHCHRGIRHCEVVIFEYNHKHS